ncbi:MAG TPA: flagellar hook-basal body complex protein FliE [Bryobacteraceae bacterium]|jgi:flagellar hook-basal body complex protein FliE
MPVTILPIRSPSVATIQPLPSIQPAGSSGAGRSSGGGVSSFSDLISNGIGTVERAQQDAVSTAQRFLSGENEDLHTVAIAEQKAEITSDLFLQLRNKAVSAYQEVMKMQL